MISAYFISFLLSQSECTRSSNATCTIISEAQNEDKILKHTFLASTADCRKWSNEDNEGFTSDVVRKVENNKSGVYQPLWKCQLCVRIALTLEGLPLHSKVAVYSRKLWKGYTFPEALHDTRTISNNYHSRFHQVCIEDNNCLQTRPLLLPHNSIFACCIQDVVV